MTHSEFNAKITPLESQVADLEKQIEALIKQQDALIKEYLNDCAIPLNTKVEVTWVSGYRDEKTANKTICFIARKRVERHNRYCKSDIVYGFNKTKKDGTMSQHSQYFCMGDILEIKKI